MKVRNCIDVLLFERLDPAALECDAESEDGRAIVALCCRIQAVLEEESQVHRLYRDALISVVVQQCGLVFNGTTPGERAAALNEISRMARKR